MRVGERLGFCQSDGRSDDSGEFVNGHVSFGGVVDHAGDRFLRFVAHLRDPFGAVDGDPVVDAGGHRHIEVGVLKKRGRDVLAAFEGCAVKYRLQVGVEKCHVVVLPVREFFLGHVAEKNCFAQLLVCDSLLLVLPHGNEEAHRLPLIRIQE